MAIITRRSKKDLLFDLPVNLLLLLVVLVILVPLWFVLVVSMTPLGQSQGGYNLFLPPTSWSIEAYRQFLTDNAFVKALVNSVISTALGVTINMVFTVLTAYALSVKTLPGRNIIMILILFTFLFN